MIRATSHISASMIFLLMKMQSSIYFIVFLQLISCRESFGFKSRQGGNKVLVVVLDGLRYDFLSTHPYLKKFVDSIHDHSRVVKLRAQLPSISNPNWMTLLTSGRPQLTGNKEFPQQEFISSRNNIQCEPWT